MAQSLALSGRPAAAGGGEPQTIVVKKKKVVSSSVFSPVGGNPTDNFVSDSDQKGVNFSQTYFQSRQTIKVQIESTFVAGYTHLTSNNLTTGEKWISGEILADVETLAKSYAFKINRLGQLTIEFYPKNATLRTQLNYGDNDLTFEVTDGSSDHFAQQTIVVKDFDVFAPSSMGFSGQVQEKSQFQGWLNQTGQNYIKSGGTTLVTGLPNIVNK